MQVLGQPNPSANRPLARAFAALLLALVEACAPADCGSPEDETSLKAKRLAEEQAINDANIWPNEVSALRYEAWWNQYWDRLRALPEKDRLAEARGIPMPGLQISPLGPMSEFKGGGTTASISGSEEPWDGTRWQAMLDALIGEGFELTRMEFRGVKFVPGERNVSSRTELWFELGLDNPNTGKLRSIKGLAEITWELPIVGMSEVKPREIHIVRATLLERAESIAFHPQHRLAAEPGQSSVQMAPVILHDFDGDERMEIMLVGANALIRWQNGAYQKPEELFSQALPLSPTGLFADFTGDGLGDFLGVMTSGEGVIVPGMGGGKFGSPRRAWSILAKTPSVLTCADIDRDGDLDVWLGQSITTYTHNQLPSSLTDAQDSPPGILLRNRGSGQFEEVTSHHQSSVPGADSLLGHVRRTQSASFVDLDSDGDQDLLTVNQFAGLLTYTNDGQGEFSLDGSLISNAEILGHGHAFGQFGGDRALDIFVASEWSPTVHRLAATREERVDYPRFREAALGVASGSRIYVRRAEASAPGSHSDEARFQSMAQAELSAHPGWNGCVAACDFDNDGDDDAFLGAGYLSGGSADEFESQFWRHDIYLGVGVEPRVLERFLMDQDLAPRFAQLRRAEISWHGYESARFYVKSASGFIEQSFLSGLGTQATVPGAVSVDLNADGRLDLLVLEEERVFSDGQMHARQSVQLYENQFQTTQHWLGIRLREGTPGFSAMGSVVRIFGPFGMKERLIVSGENRLTQPAAVVHFGLGKETAVSKVEVIWSNGQRQVLLPSMVDDYLDVQPRLDFTPIPDPPEPPPTPAPDSPPPST